MGSRAKLAISGAAMGGTISNLNKTIFAINKGPWVGFIPAGVLDLYRAYKNPELTDLFHNMTLPEYQDQFFAAGKQCAADDIFSFPFQDIGTYFKSGHPLYSFHSSRS